MVYLEYQACLDHMHPQKPRFDRGQESWVFSRALRLEKGATVVVVGMPCDTLVKTLLFGLSYGKSDSRLVFHRSSTDDHYERHVKMLCAEAGYSATVVFSDVGALEENSVSAVFFDPHVARPAYTSVLAEQLGLAARNHALYALTPNAALTPEIETFWHDEIAPTLRDVSRFFSLCFGYKGFDLKKFDKMVYAIIPVHNRLKYTRQVLHDLMAQTAVQHLKICVVDDGSTDGTGEAISSEYPDVKMIRGNGNLYWTGAVALAVETLMPSLADDDYFLLVNNDSCLPETTIESLLSEAYTPRTCVVPIAVEGIEATACGWAEDSAPILNNIDAINGTSIMGNRRFGLRTFYGRCSLFPARAVKDAGNFDPKSFPHYHGDSDFGYRTSKAGYQVIATSKVAISVIENTQTTGLHASFFDGPQSLSSVLHYLTSIKSIDNYKYLWRYLSLYNKRYRIRIFRTLMWKVIRQYAPFHYVRGLMASKK